jgi:exosome complex RNA-binding protein Csl4
MFRLVNKIRGKRVLPTIASVVAEQVALSIAGRREQYLATFREVAAEEIVSESKAQQGRDSQDVYDYLFDYVLEYMRDREEFHECIGGPVGGEVSRLVTNRWGDIVEASKDGTEWLSRQIYLSSERGRVILEGDLVTVAEDLWDGAQRSRAVSPQGQPTGRTNT